VVCSNRCGGWTFDADPTSTSGWVAGSPGDGLASVHGGGTRIPNSSGYSLALTVTGSPAMIMVPLCALAANGVDLTGYRLQADIYIDGATNFFTTYTFLFGGSSASDPQAGYRITAQWLTGEWSKIDTTFNDLSSMNLSTGLYIQFVSEGWTGNIYLDNILLTKN
jgi:hypothetical protein